VPNATRLKKSRDTSVKRTLINVTSPPFNDPDPADPTVPMPSGRPAPGGPVPPPGYPMPVGYPPPGAYPPPGTYPPGVAYGYPPPVVDQWGRPLSDKSKVVAGILQITLGGFGAGRFYIGDYKIAVTQLIVTILTCGLGHIWGIIDGVLILVNGGTDGQGRILRD
jgi:TM2 domain-containing membrane protein YozV